MPKYQVLNIRPEIADFIEMLPDEPERETATWKKFFAQVLMKQSERALNDSSSEFEQRDWQLHEINISQPWGNIKQIRVFCQVLQGPTSKKQTYQTLLSLKSIDGTIKIHGLGHEQSVLFGRLIGNRIQTRRIGIHPREEFDKKKWDNLAIYSESVICFYEKQNLSMALSLFDYLNEMKHNAPILIVDLGAGKGAISENFVSAKNANDFFENDYRIGEFHWLNVELSKVNVKISKKQNTPQVSSVSASALDFLNEPIKFFDKIELNSDWWNRSDIYIVASGLLTEAVVSFAESVRILREIKKNERVKGLLITGLNASHINLISPNKWDLKDSMLKSLLRLTILLRCISPYQQRFMCND